MTTEYTIEEIEVFDREWTDAFAIKRGWEDHHLSDPIDDLRLFFDHLTGTEILDSGCGWGRYIYRFSDAGLTYTGLDHSREMLLVADVTNPGQKFVQSTFRKMPFRSENFDGIWSCCSLSATPKKHLVEVLLEHKRVLKPGGIMMFVMPAFEWHESDEEMYTDKDGHPEIYQAHYSLDEFVGRVTEAGFQIVEDDYRWQNGSMYVLAKRPLTE